MKRKMYLPPSSKQIQHFAKTVCDHMAVEHDDASFNSIEVVSGFAGFITVVAHAEAKRLTQAQSNIESEE